MGLRDRLRRLQREAEGEMICVPQRGGTAARFPPEAGMEAIVALTEGRDHPLAQAVRASPDPQWQRTFYNAFPIDPDIPDLSE